MGYYGYHQVNKQRIKRGELTGYHYVRNYSKDIGPALVLEFSAYPFQRPIRKERWMEYLPILKKWRLSHDAG